MEKSKVYFTDFRTRLGEGLPSKLKRLMKAAGIQNMDMDHKFVAIKLHFGELGNPRLPNSPKCSLMATNL